jgi:hypothetical protein
MGAIRQLILWLFLSTALYGQNTEFPVYDPNGGGGKMLRVIDNPKIYLPDTIYLLKDSTYTMYGDDIAFQSIYNKDMVYTYSCSAGNTSGNNFIFNSSTTGNFPFTVNAFYKDYPYMNGSSIVKVFSKKVVSGDSSRICFVGNSTMQAALVSMSYLSSDVPPTKLMGKTGTTPIKYEGNPGYEVLTYMNGTTSSPFWTGSTYDFHWYRHTKLGVTKPFNYVVIALGINDVEIHHDTSYFKTTLMTNLKTLVDLVLADTTAHVIIGLESKAENSGAGWVAVFGNLSTMDTYLANMHFLWKTLIDNFDQGTYNSKVTICPAGMFIDRDNGYPKTGGIHTDAYHPNTFGYNQLGKIYYSYIQYLR